MSRMLNIVIDILRSKYKIQQKVVHFNVRKKIFQNWILVHRIKLTTLKLLGLCVPDTNCGTPSTAQYLTVFQRRSLHSVISCLKYGPVYGYPVIDYFLKILYFIFTSLYTWLRQ